MSETIKTEVSFRIDAEFYNKESLRIYSHLVKLNHNKLNELTHKIDVGFVGAMTSHYTVDVNDPILLQTKDIGEFIVDINDVIHIDSLFHKELRKSQINKENILIARSGSFGKASIWLENYTVNSSDIIIVECSDSINPYYTVAFLNSKYGKSQLCRFASGGLQGHVNLTILENLIVPLVSNQLQLEVQYVVEDAFNQYSTSKELYIESENLLLKELGFDNWEHNTENVSVKTLKDSFCSSGRLDAEYYQPKYDELFARLSNVEHDRIAKIANLNKSIEPGSEAYQDNGIPFVRVADISKFGISKPSIYLSRKEYDLDVLKPNKDTILLSKDGSVGIAYKVENDLDCITSGALLHLTIFNEDYLPDYLTLVLNSLVVQMQAERDAGGSIIQHWKPSEINNVIIPKLSMTKQKEIAATIQKSFALRHESERLLDVAKKTVEIAIGENEEKAMLYLNQNSTVESTPLCYEG